MSDAHDARIAVLEAWRQSEQHAREFDRKDIRRISDELVSLQAGIKMLRWVIGAAIASGPVVGVFFAKVIA